jgi:ribosome-associated protein
VNIISNEIENLETTEAAPDATQHQAPGSAEMEAIAKRKLELICEAADETKAQNIVALDVRRLTPIADYFMICSGTSGTHISSIAENVQDKLRMEGKVRAKPQGGAESFWIILDYGDVILHIFDEATREFYDLERLWSDAPKVDCGGSAEQAQSTPVDKSEANASN